MKKHKAFFLLSAFVLYALPGLCIKPDRNYALTPDSINWSHDKTKVETSDGFELNTWIYHAKLDTDKDTVLILAYADAGNMSYYVYHSMILAMAGYTVVTFDYRGFGESDDFEIDPDYLYYLEFTTDLEAVISAISSQYPDSKLGIWAMSMGTTVTSRAYPKVVDKIDFIIGDGYVTDTDHIISRYRARGKKLVLPEPSSTYSSTVSQIDKPLLILAASKDQITSLKDAKELERLLGPSCEVLEYPGEHLQAFQYEANGEYFGEWFTLKITEFLNRT